MGIVARIAKPILLCFRPERMRVGGLSTIDLNAGSSAGCVCCRRCWRKMFAGRRIGLRRQSVHIHGVFLVVYVLEEALGPIARQTSRDLSIEKEFKEYIQNASARG